MKEESQEEDHVDRRVGALARRSRGALRKLKTTGPIGAVACARPRLRRARGRQRRSEADAQARRCAGVRGAQVERSAHASSRREPPASWPLWKTCETLGRAPAPPAPPPGSGARDRSKRAHNI